MGPNSPWRGTESVGFSLPEVVLVSLAIALLAAIALPRLAATLARAKVAAARDVFSAVHGLARQIPAQYGRISKFHIDPEGNRFWVTVEADSTAGAATQDTVGPLLDLSSRFRGVTIKSNRRMICYNVRGLGTALGECELPNATVVFSLGAMERSVTISRAGRLLKR